MNGSPKDRRSARYVSNGKAVLTPAPEDREEDEQAARAAKKVVEAIRRRRSTNGTQEESDTDQ